MVQRWATSSGFADVAGTWNGGTLPDPGDDLYANNFTVSIRANLTANSLKKIAGTTAIAGGQFNITAAATVTITAGIAAADSLTASQYILGVNAGSAAVTITAASITGGGGIGRVGVSILAGQSGTVTINAALVGGGIADAYAVSSAATAGSIAIIGSVTGGTSGPAVNVAATAAVTVTGAVAGAISAAHGMVFGASGCTLAVTGAVSGGTASTAVGVSVASGTLSMTTTGGVTGGTLAVNYGVAVASVATLTINSALTGGTLGNAVNVPSGAVATIRGTITASNAVAAVNSAGSCRISGTLAHASNSRAPITGLWTVIAGEETEMHLFNDSAFPASNAGTAVILSLAGTNNPATGDVRYGTTYGASSTLVGTLRVPPAASVAAGVLTDNTTGTAALSLSDVLAGTGAQIAAATSG